MLVASYRMRHDDSPQEVRPTATEDRDSKNGEKEDKATKLARRKDGSYYQTRQ